MPLAVRFLPWVLAAATYGAVAITFERAPLIHVRWAASVDDAARAELEQRFALTHAHRDTERTWIYALTSTSTDTIQAIVTSPAVDDTHHLDRQSFRISPTAERRGPFITTGSAPWLPAALLTVAFGLAVAGAWLLGLAIVPIVARGAHNRTVAAFLNELRRPTTSALVTMGVGLLLVSIAYIAHLRAGAAESLPFRIGDWLVSYDTGFVRRGLPGTAILLLTTVLNVSPEQVVFWLQVVLYTLFVCLLIVLARGMRLNIWFLAFLFSPLGLLFPIYDPAVAGRKDVLFFAVFAFYAWWMPRQRTGWTHALAFTIGAATTLTHELFFFFTPYFFLMRAVRPDEALTARRLTPELALFGGSLSALLVATTLGADLHGEAQCAGLLARGFNEQLCDGILRYPVTDARTGAQFVANAIENLGYLRMYPLALALAALPLLPLFRTLGVTQRRRLLAGMTVAFVFTLPMFAVALDWGRLINIHVMAVAVVIVAFVLEDRSVPGSILGVGPWRPVAALLAVGLYLSAWSIRHCCEHALGAGLFGGR